MDQGGTLAEDEARPPLADDTSTDAPDDVDVVSVTTALGRLRQRGREERDGFDTFYRIYITVMLGLLGSYLALGAVDDLPVDDSVVASIETLGPRWIALGVALVFAAGLRSGAHGGPLAIDEVELHHVLMSPLPRRRTLSTPIIRLVAGSAAVGAVIGAGAGELAARRLPGNQVEWAVCGLLAGAAISLTGVGAALWASTSRLPSSAMTIAAALTATWAGVDVVAGSATSPFVAFGQLAVWPLDHRWFATTALVVPIGLIAVGVVGVERVSVERAQLRSRLVAQIRFALAQQDLRALVLLRRQLAAETCRIRPWWSVGSNRLDDRFPTLGRDLRSYLRWPLGRLLRVSALAGAMGVALAGVWHGTTSLVIGAGLAAYLAAIEVVEPLSEELDRPAIAELVPTPLGKIVAAHVIAAAAVMSLLWLLAGGVAFAVSLDARLLAVIAAGAVPAGGAASAAAALSIRPVDSGRVGLGVPDEFAGPSVLYRLAWPPALATLGALPVLAARAAIADGIDPISSAITTAAAVAIAASAAIGWLRYRNELNAAAQQ